MSVNVVNKIDGSLKKIAHGFPQSKLDVLRADIINNIETTDTASKDYAAGDCFVMQNGQLVEALVDIDEDTTINLTDVREITVEDLINKRANKVSGATNGNFAALDANGNLTDSGHKHSDYLTQHQDITGKADKVNAATNGNLAGLDANGNLTDSGWKSDKATTSVTGNPISIPNLKSNQLAVNPIITFEPIQAGSWIPSPSNIRAIIGYDKIEVLSCGKNLFDKNDASSIIKGYISGTILAGDAMRTVFVKCKPNTTYTVSKTAGQRFAVAYTKELPAIGISVYGAVSNNTASSITITTGADAKYIVGYVFNGSNDSGTADQMIASVQIEESASATTYEPHHKTTDLSESLGQTVYGGTYEPRTGVFTVKYKKIDLSTLSWTYQSTFGVYYATTPPDLKTPLDNTDVPNALCSKYEVTSRDGMSQTNQLSIQPENASNQRIYVTVTSDPSGELCYELKDSAKFTIQLTPHEIALSQGYNYISTNGTQIQLSYHNGELASLSDVAQVGETVNELGEYVEANKGGATVDLSPYNDISKKFEVPYDGYVNLSSNGSTTGYVRAVATDKNGKNLAYAYMNVTGTYQIQSLFVKKGMFVWSPANTVTNATIEYIPLVQ